MHFFFLIQLGELVQNKLDITCTCVDLLPCTLHHVLESLIGRKIGHFGLMECRHNPPVGNATANAV